MDDSAELFDAIAHPTRIKILKILEKTPATFASLKRQLNIDSSGNLDHHLKKLGPLITTQNGNYTLTEAGRQALESVGAVEDWKESERLRSKAFSEKPKLVNLLLCLTLTSAILPSAIVWMVTTGFAYNVPFLPYMYGAVAAISASSFIGLLLCRSWAWTLAVIQAALMLAYAMVPLYLDLYLFHALSIGSTENPPAFVWTATIVLAFVEAGLLWTANKKEVKEFLGTQHATPLPHRALLGGALGILSGLLEVFAGNLLHFSSAPYGGAALYFIGLFLYVGGPLILLGGVMVLLRKYLVGGVMILVFSFFPVPYFITSILFSSMGYNSPFYGLSIVVAVLVGLLPIVAALLAFLSRPKQKEN